MSKISGLSLLSALVLLLAGCSTIPRAVPSQLNGSVSNNVKLITDFEDDSYKEVIIFKAATTEVNTDPAFIKNGKRSLKVTLHPDGDNDYPGLYSGSHDGKTSKLNGNWESYDWLKWEIYYTGEKPLPICVRIDDSASKDYKSRYNNEGDFSLRPGWNSFEIPIKALKTSAVQKARMLDPAKITLFSLMNTRSALGKTAKTFYIDNIRLERTEQVNREGILAFDFGGEKMPVMLGFTRVGHLSLYNDKVGYGFSKENPELFSSDLEKTDDLIRDFVYAKEGEKDSKISFSVKLKDGKYKVWTIVKNLIEGSLISRKSGGIYAQSALQYEDVVNSSTFYDKNHLFKLLDYDFSNKRDVWSDYVDNEFKQIEFEAEVKNGKLEIDFINRPIFTLVVFPVESETNGRKFLEEVNALRRKQFYSRVYYDLKPSVNEYSAGKQEIEEGMTLFVKNYMDEIYPSTRPKKEEIVDKVSVKLAGNEDEPVAICILPHEDAKDITVSVSALVNGGNVISSDNITVKYAQYADMPAGGGMYITKTQFLRTFEKLTLEKDVIKALWVFVKVPPGAKAGEYKGTITINGRVKKVLNISAVVYPFDLASPDASFGWYSANPGRLNYMFEWFPGTEDKLASMIEKEYRDLSEHNFTSNTITFPAVVSVDDNLNVKLDFSLCDKEIAAMKKTGINIAQYGQGNVLSIGRQLTDESKKPGAGFIEYSEPHRKAYINAVKQIDAYFKNNGVKLAFWAVDEPRESNLNRWNRNFEGTMKYLGYLKEAGVIRTVTPMGDKNGDVDYLPMLNELEIVQTHPWEGSKESIRIAREKGKPELWLYNSGADRLSFGYYVWKVGARGRWQWVYAFSHYAYNPVFSESMYDAVGPSPDGPVPTVGYENAKEGIDDFRYIQKLNRAIALAKDKKNKPAEINKAVDLLKEIEKKLPEYPGGGLESGEEVGEAYKGDVNKLLNIWRERIAEIIIALEK